MQWLEQGLQVATADADGCVKVWELRTGAQRLAFSAGQAAATQVCFDASGQARCSPRACGNHPM